MDHIIRQVTHQFLHALPSGNNHLTVADLRTAGLPKAVIERLQVDLFQNLEETLHPPRTDWADMEHPSVASAWKEFVQTIREQSRMPSAFKASLMETAVADVVDQMVEPRKNIPAILYGSERALTYEQLVFYADRIVLYRHLVAGVLRYMDRRNLTVLPYEKCVDVISQIDQKLTDGYTPLNWAQLMSPWFELLGKRIDADLVRRFFRDKKRSELADAVPEELDSLSKTELIERLSAPQLPVSYEQMDDKKQTQPPLARNEVSPLEYAGTYYEEFLRLREENRKKWNHLTEHRPPSQSIDPAAYEAQVDTLKEEIQEDEIEASVNHLYQEAVEEPHAADDTNTNDLNNAFAEDTSEDQADNSNITDQPAAEKVSPAQVDVSFHDIAEEGILESEKQRLMDLYSAEVNDEEPLPVNLSSMLQKAGYQEDTIEDSITDEVDDTPLNEPEERLQATVEAAELKEAEIEETENLSDLDKPTDDSPALHTSFEQDTEVEDALDIDAMFSDTSAEVDTETKPAETEEESKPLSDKEGTEVPESVPSATPDVENDDDFDIDAMFGGAPAEDEPGSPIATETEQETPSVDENSSVEATAEAVEDTDDDDFDIDALFGGPSSEDETKADQSSGASAAHENEAQPQDEAASEDDFDIDAMFGGSSSEAEETPKEEETKTESVQNESDDDFDINAMFESPADDKDDLTEADSKAQAKPLPGTSELDAMIEEQGGSLENLFADGGEGTSLGEHEGLLEYLSDSHGYYIKELFEGEVEAFSTCIGDLDTFNTWSEASEYLYNDIFTAFGIEMVSEPAIKFVDDLQTYFKAHKSTE